MIKDNEYIPVHVYISLSLIRLVMNIVTDNLIMYDIDYSVRGCSL